MMATAPTKGPKSLQRQLHSDEVRTVGRFGPVPGNLCAGWRGPACSNSRQAAGIFAEHDALLARSPACLLELFEVQHNDAWTC
jgi:hypothetical protein